ncbi:MAG TPA: SAM-dependent methyltransferase [Acidimicrobiales bacterium]|nr:SAM-dependent methyltransferase [Acidimicrobiales bacterium]
MIRRLGPVTFAELMEVALYDAGGGFFVTGGAAGRAGDFLTSPEVGPLFGAVMARALDAWWAESGQPDPYIVVDAGAGAGTLAAAVRAAQPACAPALHYVMVERSEALRARHSKRVPLEPPSAGSGIAGADEDDEPGALHRPIGPGPTFTSLGAVPAVPLNGIVIANELLDNLPFHLLERGGRGEREGWDEVRVGEQDGRLIEVLVPAPPALSAEAATLVPRPTGGSRIPLQMEARSWLSQALSLVELGRVVVIDYGDTTPSLAARPPAEWLRTYRGHHRGGNPLEQPGSQDITCEVAVDQLARVRRPDLVRSQAEFLESHGIEELVVAARAVWQQRAHLGDMDALKARSRVGEAAALTDPAGLGSFRVLEWAVG